MGNGDILINAIQVVILGLAAVLGTFWGVYERFWKSKKAKLEYEKDLEKKERERGEQNIYYLNLLNQQSQLTADILAAIKDSFLLANERLLSEVATHVKFAKDLSNSVQIQFKEILSRINVLEHKQEQIIATVKELQNDLKEERTKREDVERDLRHKLHDIALKKN